MSAANKNTPVICGVEITTDEEGRFNLNALHKASGGDGHKRPSKWLATDQAKELISELEKQSPISGLGENIIKVIKGGVAPGTFAHELLAVEYAGWISPAYRLTVNQTFLDYRTGKLKPSFDPVSALSDAEFLRATLLSYSERVIALEHRVEEMKPDVEALDRIAKSDGSMCITSAAKHLQVQPKFLFKLMSENEWIYRRAGGKNWLAYQNRIQSGVLEHKVTTIERSDGSEKVVEQVLVTAKGLTRLSKMLGVTGVAA
ncbi:phage antirepressor KilAC domain-containing protein [Mixta calida]|uniref:phage antirepressor KilAC domain-containing protein n=1 Tax=Mixta calida TaxID=665913 RepID=UPI0028A23333|nr:phage antirepressor KilAC domain-containing protein [Mixta calida]